MSVLEKLYGGTPLKQLNINELNCLCEEIREKIITVACQNGGHLSSNLGSVELTVAIHYVFDIPMDKLIFDVGHQSYTHKILTDRLSGFDNIRKSNGLSGFPDPMESKADAFLVGHAGTSISAGLGYCYSRDSLNEDYFVIDVVGDASFFNGENLEAITSSKKKPNKFLVIFNDNGMSISKNNNGLYKLVSKVTIRKSYTRFNSFLQRTIGKIFIGKFLKSIKRSLKRGLSVNSFMDSLGLKYVGKFDGHDLKTLIKILTDIKNFEEPTLLHVQTKKGKGHEDAENDSSRFHGVSKNLEISDNYFSSGISAILEKQIEKTPEIVAITAGMKDGVGLTSFAENHPNSFVDVGIQEEHAVTLSAGMAISGTKPIVFIYSTFLQRGYDQIVHDVCMQNLPVVFMIDRAGLVGADGKTHQGVFDLSYLTHLPNVTVLAPKNLAELEKMLSFALSKNSPVAIRYPNGKICDNYSDFTSDNFEEFEVLHGDLNADNVLLAVGPRAIEICDKIKSKTKKSIAIVNARTIKPLDSKTLDKILGKNIITIEENSKIGGFGSCVLGYYSNKGVLANVSVVGVNDEFVHVGTIEEQLAKNGITPDEIIKLLR
ncbi:MAG: 1-deoxy-D-xylulose-5-phosphate synthase [Clostridia bacterium]|nr:1-deoxy-D-xylulose-5-phosphate synthase [Clostridia bacterium]